MGSFDMPGGHQTDMEADWPCGVAEGTRPCPSQWAPGPAEREDNHGGMGTGSITFCSGGAGKGNNMATVSGCVPNEGWAPGVEPQSDTTTSGSTTMEQYHR